MRTSYMVLLTQSHICYHGDSLFKLQCSTICVLWFYIIQSIVHLWISNLVGSSFSVAVKYSMYNCTDHHNQVEWVYILVIIMYVHSYMVAIVDIHSHMYTV